MSRKIGTLFEERARANLESIVLGPTEQGLLIHAQPGVDAGDQFRVRLMSTDATHGYIDFAA